jgi:hypothetical protein
MHSFVLSCLNVYLHGGRRAEFDAYYLGRDWHWFSCLCVGLKVDAVLVSLSVVVEVML